TLNAPIGMPASTTPIRTASNSLRFKKERTATSCSEATLAHRRKGKLKHGAPERRQRCGPGSGGRSWLGKREFFARPRPSAKAHDQRRLALATFSAMKRGSAKAATCTSGVQYLVGKRPALR